MRTKLTGGSVAYGWDEAGDLVEQQRTGSFLKLADGESAIFTFTTKPLAYYCHRVPALDRETGAPIMGSDGRQVQELIVCSKVYGNGPCQNCDAQDEVTLRTVAGVAIFDIGKDGRSLNFRDTSVIEGGPKVWKQSIMPLVREWGPNHMFKITRKGMGLRTAYTVIPLQASRSAAITERLKTVEPPDLREILQLNQPIE